MWSNYYFYLLFANWQFILFFIRVLMLCHSDYEGNDKMERLLKVVKWLFGCWFFVIGTAMLLYVSRSEDYAPAIIVLFAYGAVFLMFETKQINKPLFAFSSGLVIFGYLLSDLVLLPNGIEFYNVYMTWSAYLAVVGGPLMYWAYDKWGD